MFRDSVLRRPAWALVFAAAAAAGGPPAAHAADARRPNIVFILADDLGWRDISPNGSTYYPTPNLERLAQRGVRFTRAYAANPFCSPTRASIMTGQWPARIGITVPACHVEEEVLEKNGLVDRRPAGVRTRDAVFLTRLKREYRTLAEELHDAGYATGHFGKWHLGRDPYNPQNQGFDVDVPHTYWPGPPAYVAPWAFPKEVSDHFSPRTPDEHLEDRMADEASQFIEANKDRPFFLNYWAFSVHGPWKAKESLIAHYAAERDPFSPQRTPVYAAMVHSLDDAVGTLLNTLDRLGLADNTIIVFFSDNGGVSEPQPHAGFADPITSNAPLRAGKGSVYEGGVRVPLLVAWPGHTKPGTVSDELVQSTDFYPTFLDILGLPPRPRPRRDGATNHPPRQRPAPPPPPPHSPTPPN
ncbi:MAG: sulfatase, partial [Verrucomicrobiota bacterium]|nr:sulfatase [Verrucomicrobiota bacterium]